MAFNPLKKQVEPPIEYESSPNNVQVNEQHEEYDTLAQYDSIPDTDSTQEPTLYEMKKTLQFEGQNISDLENSGLQTINLLKVASQNVIDRPKFNVPLLDATPINFVLQSLGAKKVKENLYEVYSQEISVKENKWFNKTQSKGHVNAISLLKHLTAISEHIDEQENQKTLFIAACKKLTAIHDSTDIQEMIVEQDNIAQASSNSNKDESTKKEEFKYEPSEAVKKAQAGKKNNIDWNALCEQLNSIPLNLVMEHIGANPNEDGQRGKWKIWKTGHNMQITGQQWHSWNAQRGGFGGISLLAFQLGIEHNLDDRIDDNKKHLRSLAIKELIKVFGSEYNLNSIGGDSTDTPNYKEPFSMPHVIDFKINAVKQYLNEKRGIPMWIINKQIKAGSLFAGFPSDWKIDPNLNDPDKLSNDKVWATFLAVNGNAAEMRAIERNDQYAKILAKGSDKELGGFLIRAEKDCNEKTVTACEAAVDTLSYHALYPGRIVTSCMGVNFNLAIKAAVEALERDYKFQFAFDNDLAGNEAAVRFRDELITEIGEEDYNKYIQDEKIGYFDLGIKCLIKTIENNETFYFDVRNDDMGRTAATMFQEQLFKTISREKAKELIQKGKIKYANIAPIYGMITEPEKEAEKAINLLMSSKPFYLVLKEGDPDEHEDAKAKREAFESAFFSLAGPQLDIFENEGKIIYKKQAFAKDWNEYLSLVKHEPTIQESLQELEKKYVAYAEETVPAKKSRKKP